MHWIYHAGSCAADRHVVTRSPDVASQEWRRRGVLLIVQSKCRHFICLWFAMPFATRIICNAYNLICVWFVTHYICKVYDFICIWFTAHMILNTYNFLHELIYTQEFRYVYLFSYVHIHRQWLKIDTYQKICITNRTCQKSYTLQK